MTTYYNTIAFFHDYQDKTVTEFLEGEIEAKELVDYLACWDSGETTPFDSTEPNHGTDDRTEVIGEYILSWNSRLGYAGLDRQYEYEGTDNV